MNARSATSMIVISAMVMGGLYAWRWIVGGPASAKAKVSAGKLIGLGSLVSPEGFLVAWGAIYLMLALGAAASPQLAGAFSLLILLGGLVANFSSVATNATALIQSKTSRKE